MYNLFIFRFVYLVEGNYFTLSAVDLEFVDSNEIIPLNITGTKDWVPSTFSFACSKRIVFKNSDFPWKVVISGLQTQVFKKMDLDKQTFGPVWDCVGFFSVPIWCGLISTLICTFILLWGLYMLAEVRTMDRFDDPKGKTIMVPTSD